VNPQERLQPSLLDRLTDDQPEARTEPRERRVLSLAQLREAVKRDLAWLLNTTALSSVEDLSPYPNVARSTLNYGIPDLTGKALSGVDLNALKQLMRQAILQYEPRILRGTLRIEIAADKSAMSHNAVRFDIEGELWAEPAPLRVLLRSEFDLESGHIKIDDAGGRG